MSELLEKTNYNEEQYFNRKMVNHYDYNKPTASSNYSVSDTDEYIEEVSRNVVKSKRKLSKFETIWLSLCSIIAVGAIAFSFLIRVDIIEQRRSINNLEDSITEYRSNTDVLNSQITEQFNYHQIKDAADTNGMTIEKDRVRTVEK
ncbi:hypothetical protein HYQ40_02785 [Aerococcaceae bacterium DSM 111021]|nr:hypothetical protein [Aerococcaceae bacterium DSM 111021]